MAADERVFAKVSGGSNDSLEDVVHAAYSEFQWLYDKDDMAFVRSNEVITVDEFASFANYSVNTV